jgi:sterol 3beta-glucosyltransferase
MRIDILAFGSRGDVQPYVALGRGLKSAGHQVRVVALGGVEQLVRSHGLDYVAVAASRDEIATSAAGRSWIQQRDGVTGFLRGFIPLARSLVRDGMTNYSRVCQDTDALIASASGLLLAVHFAEKMRLPLFRAQLAPSVPTRYDWNGRTSRATSLLGAGKSAVGSMFRLLLWQGLRDVTNRCRSEILALPPLPLQEPFRALNRRRVPLLDGYSAVVVAKPPDWGSWVHVTGYWFLDEVAGWAPPPEMTEFMESGPPPVFVGFGSTPFPQPEAATDLVVKALKRAGQRGLVVAGSSGLGTGRLADDVLSVDAVPHSWLFPRVSAAVHHGGAGVTGAATRAGLPSVVVPIFADQPFWGDRVFQLGAGPRPIPAKRLSMESLANAIRCATTDTAMRSRAASLGAQIRAEDGVARAVEAFHQYV